jgi:hypothetical protein
MSVVLVLVSGLLGLAMVPWSLHCRPVVLLCRCRWSVVESAEQRLAAMYACNVHVGGRRLVAGVMVGGAAEGDDAD